MLQYLHLYLHSFLLKEILEKREDFPNGQAIRMGFDPSVNELEGIQSLCETGHDIYPYSYFESLVLSHGFELAPMNLIELRYCFSKQVQGQSTARLPKEYKPMLIDDNNVLNNQRTNQFVSSSRKLYSYLMRKVGTVGLSEISFHHFLKLTGQLISNENSDGFIAITDGTAQSEQYVIFGQMPNDDNADAKKKQTRLLTGKINLHISKIHK